MLTARQQHCLDGLGITRWVGRSSVQLALDDTAAQVLPTEVEVTAHQRPHIEQAEQQPVTQTETVETVQHRTKQSFELDHWPAIESAIQSCHNCALGDSCTRKVPGKGNQEADLMIIGEAPGHDEDLQGLPFVGRAGQLLDRMLQAIELDPQQVYITNILKCRPPNNRDPHSEEISACSQFLNAQIKQVKPKVIFSVGRISAQNLLQQQSPLGRLRGKQYTLPDTDIPLLVTYHPAYLLRNPAEKAKVWQDLKALHRILRHATD
jgi:uracil-DNA glycosylase